MWPNYSCYPNTRCNAVRPAIEPFSYPASLREGQRAFVMCAVISGDLPINISWTKDGEHITESNPESRHGGHPP
ncbi:hypothetical protein MTO96_035079 [Rhipicephalus appendiculatus]